MTRASITAPRIVAPDSSQWAKWIDATKAADLKRRKQALELQEQILARGYIPLLTLHHLEELLSVADKASAEYRVRFIRALPMIAWLRLPGRNTGMGSIAQILSAEAVATHKELRDPISIRNEARRALLHTGSGADALGEPWVWDVLRPQIQARRPHSNMVAALSTLSMFDEDLTIGELSQMSLRSPAEIRAQFGVVHSTAFQEARDAGNTEDEARSMADDFLSQVAGALPPTCSSVRDLVVTSYLARDLDAGEIGDECTIAELNALATFRQQLRAVASDTGIAFDELKRLPRQAFPSWLVLNALRSHGQKRTTRPGSDLTDNYLGALAAYCEVTYVDKRTAEDFRRALTKEPKLHGLVGDIRKAKDFAELVD